MNERVFEPDKYYAQGFNNEWIDLEEYIRIIVRDELKKEDNKK